MEVEVDRGKEFKTYGHLAVLLVLRQNPTTTKSGSWKAEFSQSQSTITTKHVREWSKGTVQSETIESFPSNNGLGEADPDLELIRYNSCSEGHMPFFVLGANLRFEI